MFKMFVDFSGVLLMKIKPRRVRIPFDAPTIAADKRVRKMNEPFPRGSEQLPPHFNNKTYCFKSLSRSKTLEV